MDNMVKKEFDFLGKRKIWYLISVAIILIGLVSLCFQGFNKGIDFTGGNIYQVQFEQEFTTDEVREVVEQHVTSSPLIQKADGNSVSIRTETMTAEEGKAMMADLEKEVGPNKLLSSQFIGPVIGSELLRNAIVAFIIAIILMLIYITVRFKFFFAIAALIPLIHDVLVTMGIVSLLQIEIDSAFIAAILTIIGYSINATIVIFDRVRENLSYGLKGGFVHNVNTSINQTLGRSINTVIAVLLLVISLLLFGGETTKNFIFTLLVGLLAGGYSSIFIAGPMLADLVMKVGGGNPDKKISFKKPAKKEKAVKKEKTAKKDKANKKDK